MQNVGNKNKMRKVLFFNVFIILVFSFTVFGFKDVYSAGCNIMGSFYPDKIEVHDKSIINFTSQINFQGTALNDCAKKQFIAYIDFVNYRTLFRDPIQPQNITLSSDSFVWKPNFNIDLSKFNLISIGSGNKLDFQLIIQEKDTVGNIKDVLFSGHKEVNLTGTTGSGTGKLEPLVGILPRGASYAKDEEITIRISVDNSKVDALPVGLTSIFIQPEINGKKISGKNVPRNSFAPVSEIATRVISANGFRDGMNEIKVSLWQSNTQVRLGEASATLNANGLGSIGGQKIWACKAGDGKYACSPSNDPNLNDVSATGGTCDTFPLVPVQIERTSCGKTDAEIRASSGGGGAGGGAGSGSSGSTTPPSGGGAGGGNPVDSKLEEFIFNPLPTDSLTGALLSIAKGFLAIVALWAVVFIIIGGFRLVMSQGQEEAYAAAKKTITWAILGLVVAMFSFSIIAIVQNLLGVKIPKPPSSDGPVVNTTK